MSEDYSIGVEEEYFVVDLRSRNARATMPKKFYRKSKALLKDHVTSEMLQCQIEVMTAPCVRVDEAHRQLRRLRAALAEQAARDRLGVVAVSTHPIAHWREQKPTQKGRYGKVMDDLQMLGLRGMLCGMHVHVELPDPGRRIEVMYRMIPFLPTLLALSASSPFWEGQRTGLLSYRPSVHDEQPRTGLPELFRTAADYQAYVDALEVAGVIENASFVWWDIRPSVRHPTLELRISDACTHLADGICIAAFYRCLARHLFNHPELNAEIGAVDRAIALENKWRAQRHGTKANFVARGSAASRSVSEAVDELLDLLREDSEALECAKELAHVRTILARGTSAHQQVRVYAQARIAGRSRSQALRDVVDFLLAATAADEEVPLGA